MLSFRVLRTNLNSLKRFLWTVESRGDDLVMREDENEELRFPHIWLRDNCQCPSCFHKKANSRIIDIEHFYFNSRPVEATIKNTSLDVSWSDNHRSTYSLSWLLDRQFTPQNQSDQLTKHKPLPRPWSASEFLDILQRYKYKDILNSDQVLLQWLESLTVHGIALVEGAGNQPGQLQALANRVSFLKQTYYGETFSVKTKPETSNVAYLSGPLQLHTDLPYYHYSPGVVLLHCVTQFEGKGGDSELVDGLLVCNWLQKNHPHHYWILSTVLVEWEDIVVEDGKEYHAVYRAPVICEGPNGMVARINWSQPQRSSHFNVPVDQVTPWYRALEVFAQQMHSPQCKVTYKMSPGEIITFNNFRLVHGRTNFTGNRNVEGGYIDWDYVYSKIRVLRKQLKAS